VFLSLDGTALVQIVDFIVFLIALNIVFMRPVGAAIAKRRAYLNSLASDIESAAADEKALHAQAEAKRAAARRDADEAIAKARAAAQAEAAEITAAASVKAAGIVDDAQRAVAAEVATARTKESEIVASLAQTLLDRAGVAA
jgi:F-type H+-transporting ATPase subunit b